MGWEKRKQKNYYYRKRRQGRRVISEYIGSSASAEAAATLDLHRRQTHQAEQQALAAVKALDAEIDQICRLIQTLTQAYLLTAGFHTYRGQWRKKRNT